MFLKEGICTDYQNQRDLVKLLRYETSIDADVTDKDAATDKDGKPRQILHSFDDYISRMPPEQKSIYYINASNKQFALNSPYMEQIRQKGLEVIFAYTPIDDFVMKNLGEVNNRKLLTIDSSEVAEELQNMLTEEERKQQKEQQEKDSQQHSSLVSYFESVLGEKVSSVKVNAARNSTAPAIIVDNESAAIRKMMQFSDPSLANQSVKKQKLEIHTQHPVIKGLAEVKDSNPDLAKIVVEQVFDNACIAADLIDNPRSMLGRLNQILIQTIQQQGTAGKACSTQSATSTDATTQTA
jgi:TNF receptor-associated protein 1